MKKRMTKAEKAAEADFYAAMQYALSGKQVNMTDIPAMVAAAKQEIAEGVVLVVAVERAVAKHAGKVGGGA